MKYRDLAAFLKSGKQPVVKFNKKIVDLETFAEPGMLAKILYIVREDNSGDKYAVASVKVDFGVAKEHNLVLQDHNWYIGSGTNKKGTVFEAGLMKPDDMTEELCLDMPDEHDLPLDLVAEEGSPLADYLKVKAVNPSMTDTYAEWLEEHYRRLTAEIRRLEEDIEEMSMQNAGASR